MHKREKIVYEDDDTITYERDWLCRDRTRVTFETEDVNDISIEIVLYQNGRPVASTYELRRETIEWLKENVERYSLAIDRGDWGEGMPFYTLRFKTVADAKKFFERYNKREQYRIYRDRAKSYETFLHPTEDKTARNDRIDKMIEARNAGAQHELMFAEQHPPEGWKEWVAVNNVTACLIENKFGKNSAMTLRFDDKDAALAFWHALLCR